MKRLIIIRHSKSNWESGVLDIDRELNDAGVLNILKIAKEASEKLPKNPTIWCSVSVRTTQTARLFCKENLLDINKIVFKKELYTFCELELELEIKKCHNDIESLILFGHNEAITNFVNKFGDKFIENVPTAGFVYIEFEQNSWKNINKGKIIQTIFPKDLQ